MPRIITRTPLAMKLRERTPRAFPDKDTGDVGLFLGLHLVSNGSVAIFCGRKDSVTKLSRRLIDIYDGDFASAPIDVSDQGEIGKLAFLASLYLGEAAATHPGADDRVQELATHAHARLLPRGQCRQASAYRDLQDDRGLHQAHADGDLHSIIRRSPLPPSVAANLQAWVAVNLDAMNEANLD